MSEQTGSEQTGRSASAALCLDSVDAIVAALELEQIEHRVLESTIDGAPVGAHSVYGVSGGVHVVYVGMTVEQFGLDSHMMFAFTPAESAVPHFTVDSVMAGPHYAFHLDLIPRVDPGANLAYLDHCFGPLTESHDSVAEIEGLTPAHLAPRQWQLMSAWMLAHRADEVAFAAVRPTVDSYRNHWMALVAAGVPEDIYSGISPDQLAARDAANRAAIFSPEVDPVWARVDQLLGADVSAEIQSSLKSAARGA